MVNSCHFLLPYPCIHERTQINEMINNIVLIIFKSLTRTVQNKDGSDGGRRHPVRPAVWTGPGVRVIGFLLWVGARPPVLAGSEAVGILCSSLLTSSYIRED